LAVEKSVITSTLLKGESAVKNKLVGASKDPLCRFPVGDIGRDRFDTQPLAHRCKVARLSRDHPDPRALIDERLHNAEPQSAAAAGNFGVPGIACPRQRLIEFRLDHRLDETVHTIPHGGFDRIEPIVKKLGSRRRSRLLVREVCDRAWHCLVFTGASTPESVGLNTRRLRSLQFPTKPATLPLTMAGTYSFEKGILSSRCTLPLPARPPR
jgi:hypothetical protein